MKNTDYTIRLSISTDLLDWDLDKKNHIQTKNLSSDEKRETALIKITNESVFSEIDEINSVEIIVLSGIYSNEFGDFEEGSYLLFPKENAKLVHTKDRCTFFRKKNYLQNPSTSIIQTRTETWRNGQGNLMVMPLSEHAALVKWPKNERFVKHQHYGGEEIFVLSGTFMDEHGVYPKHTWIRSPHLSIHYPFVEEETIIFVKTGHLLPK